MDFEILACSGLKRPHARSEQAEILKDLVRELAKFSLSGTGVIPESSVSEKKTATPQIEANLDNPLKEGNELSPPIEQEEKKNELKKESEDTAKPALTLPTGERPRFHLTFTYRDPEKEASRPDAINQYFASQGYVTISVNYRSGIGYGAEFRNAPNTGGRGNSEYQDVLAAGEYLRDRADVDPERIGLWGLSYGGILTAQGLARNSDLFAAGFDLAGVHLRGNSIEEGNLSYESSAISAIDGWTSPVLLLHGDDDRNVPFRQTTGLVQLLRAKGVYYELIVFPDDVHDSLLYDRWILSFEAGADFFRRFVVEKESTPPSGGSR